jgi:hypothetical protein
MDDRTSTLTSAADPDFDRWAGMAAIAGAVVALVYSVSFVVLKNMPVYSTALIVGSLLSAVALFAVYERVRGAGSIARLGVVFGLAGLFGAAIHGAYDLAVVLHPEDAAGTGGGPLEIDPRGFLTFGSTGIGVLLLSWAGLQVRGLPRPLLYLGIAFGVLLIIVYLGRLIILDATNLLVLGPAALTGLVVGPLWYAWLGWLLLNRRA